MKLTLVSLALGDQECFYFPLDGILLWITGLAPALNLLVPIYNTLQMVERGTKRAQCLAEEHVTQ